MTDLSQTFGAIDIYLFDQILRGRIGPGLRIFDAGCGGGRNLAYFLREGYDVYACDRCEEAISAVRGLAARLAPGLPAENFRVESLGGTRADSAFDAEFADVVISCAVLHFAEDDREFESMLEGSWRLLRPGGLFFCRLASSIGIEPLVRPIEGRRHALPDGSDRYLVDESCLLEWTDRLRGSLLDPIKTSVVQNLRSMTTWVVRKDP